MKVSGSPHRKQTGPCRSVRLTDIVADVMTCPGGLGDDEYPALEIRLAEFRSPYVLRFTLPAIVYKALSEQIDPVLLYETIASAVNSAGAPDSADCGGPLRDPN